MGLYVNPPRDTKEGFLQKHGRTLTVQETLGWEFTIENPELPVIYVARDTFTALHIICNSDDLGALMSNYGGQLFIFSESSVAAITVPPSPYVSFAVKKAVLVREDLSGVTAQELQAYMESRARD